MYKIIDSHAHIFPQKIAEKATVNIGNFYGLPMSTTAGTVEGLLEEGTKAGISRYVVHSTATTKNQVSHINKFIFDEVQKHSKEFIGYMTLHPDMNESEIKNEIELCLSQGFKGIKLHPDFQKFNIDCDEAKKIYRNAEGVLPILFHTGDLRYDYSRPARLANVVREFPKLTVIGAHFGGYSCWEEIDCYKGLKNIYFDTSSALMFINPKKAVEFINYFGAEWFFFGTDYPMWKPSEELARFLALDLTDKQRKMILSENYERVFNV